MREMEFERGVILVLDRGEKIQESLSALMKRRHIPSATVVGLGAVMDSRLGFYHLNQKHYDERLFADEMELVSLTGNLTWFDGNPAPHCHVTLGDSDFRAHAGHLFEATTAVTVELQVEIQSTRLHRYPCPAIGLNLIEWKS